MKLTFILKPSKKWKYCNFTLCALLNWGKGRWATLALNSWFSYLYFSSARVDKNSSAFGLFKDNTKYKNMFFQSWVWDVGCFRPPTAADYDPPPAPAEARSRRPQTASATVRSPELWELPRGCTNARAPRGMVSGHWPFRRVGWLLFVVIKEETKGKKTRPDRSGTQHWGLNFFLFHLRTAAGLYYSVGSLCHPLSTPRPWPPNTRWERKARGGKERNGRGGPWI